MDRKRAHRVSTCNWLDRVIAIHRWLEGDGEDVLIVANLQDEPRQDYRIGFPADGAWIERFNSEACDCAVNAEPASHASRVIAVPLAWDGMPASANVALPANGFAVFTR